MSVKRSSMNRFRPHFEKLETRDMMSVTSVTLSDGLLRVELDGANDNVRISESSLPKLVMASNAGAIATTSLTSTVSLTASRDLVAALPGTITVTDLTQPGQSWSFNRSAVKRIEVDGPRSFGDTNTIISNSSLPTVIDLRNSKATSHVETGAGNDTVYGSEGNDFISTGAGDDIIAAGDGDDTIDAGAGSNTMFGGIGNDTLTAAASSVATNLMYGDAGNDTISSFCKNDVVDGGADIDTVRVKTGTFIVRNAENGFIIDVPLGNAVTDNRLSARQAANRFLQAYGLPKITHGIVLNDSKSGLTPSRLLSLVREVKPDATLNSSAGRGTLASILLQGKPVIAKVAPAGSGPTATPLTWVVFTGFDSVTKLFTFVGRDGQQHTTSLPSTTTRAIIF